MTDEINKYIHVEIMGNDCWHTFGDVHEMTVDFQFPCHNCDKSFRTRFILPDYCSDGSPRRLLNEVIEKIDPYLFQDALGNHLSSENPMTAEQIARACVEAHKNGRA